MSLQEAGYIIKKSEDDYINEWNMTRMLMYSVIQSQATKKINPTDVMKFPWDKKDDEDKVVVTKEQREELIRKSKEIEKKLNSNGR